MCSVQALGGCSASLPPGRWLDLYSGTGSVGIEALSRGCESVRSFSGLVSIVGNDGVKLLKFIVTLWTLTVKLYF